MSQRYFYIAIQYVLKTFLQGHTLCHMTFLHGLDFHHLHFWLFPFGFSSTISLLQKILKRYKTILMLTLFYNHCSIRMYKWSDNVLVLITFVLWNFTLFGFKILPYLALKFFDSNVIGNFFCRQKAVQNLNADICDDFIQSFFP